MIEIVLYFSKDIYDIFNIEDGYLLLDNIKYPAIIEYNENYNLFTFIIDKSVKYTMKININNHVYDCFTQPLFRNNDELHPFDYKISYEELNIKDFVSSDEDEDSYG
jgi:hypothetical protein